MRSLTTLWTPDGRPFSFCSRFQSHRPGSSIVPRMKSSSWDQDSKQQNMCTMEGVERRGSCTVDPDVFGRVLDVKQTGE